MIIKNDIQGSQKWHIQHGSVPSASCFDKIITTKGDKSKQANDYMLQLAGTRVFGVYEDSYQSFSMAKGLERELEMKELYSIITGNTLSDVGFCYYDERLDRGASPDSLINDDGCFEGKAPLLKTHVKYILADKLPTEYFIQTQGELYCTGREWLHFMSYFPDAPPFIIKVERNEAFISKLDKAIDEFNEQLAELCEKLSKLSN